MTLDKQKVEEQSFVLRCNVSACSLNLANQNEQAWITICGHIFCANCGSAELGNIPVNCPTCSHVLTSPFDILKSQLSPPSHFIKTVLLGLHPDDCLEAAQHGIAFWNGQSKLQLDSVESVLSATQTQVVEIQNYYEDKVAEMSREIVALREECHRVKEELKQKSQTPMDQGRLYSNVTSSQPEKQFIERSCGGTITSGVVKKQSYPPPSIPPQSRLSSRDINRQAKRQFLGKF